MDTRHFRNRSKTSGQGLVEYAIIIALVALVSIVILGLIGMAANRNFGLICSIFGCREDHDGDKILAIDRGATENYTTPILPLCAFFGTMDKTLFYVGIFSNIDPSKIYVDLDNGERLTVVPADYAEFGGADPRWFRERGIPRFKAVQEWTGAQLDKCANAAVVQAENITIMAPVTKRCYDSPVCQ